MACSLPFPDTMMGFALRYLKDHDFIANYERILSKVNTYKIFHFNGKDEMWSWKDLEREVKKRCPGGFAGPKVNPTPNTDIVGEIWEEIKKKYTDIENLIEDSKILYGLAQSGKTMYLMCAVWGINFVLDKKSILILMNSSGSYAQVSERDIFEFNEYIEDICRELRVGDYESYQLIGEGFQGVSRNLAIKEGKNVFLYAMGNTTQLKKLLGVVEEVKPYHLVIDESDTLVKHCDVEKQKRIATGKVYQSLLEQASGVINVTATPFANFNQAGREQGTIILRPSEFYRGAGTGGITIRNFEGDARKNMDVAREVILRALRESSECPGKYTALLAVTHERNENHERLAKKLKRASPSTRVFTYDSKGGNRIAEVGNNGRMIFTAHVRAVDLFNEFESLGGGKKYVIVSGFKASRAETFRPSRLRVNDVGERISGGDGGLTCMVYDPSDTAHCAAKIQAMRISGNYAIDYPEITLWVRKEIEESILGELGNLVKIAATCAEVCDTRTAMEGEELVVVGKHDRAGVDDTKLEGKSSVFTTDFATAEAAKTYYETLFPSIEYGGFMTEGVRHMEKNIPGMRYGDDIDGRSAEGRALQSEIKEDFHIGSTTQIAWRDARYKDLHNPEVRFKAGSNYCCSHVVGDCTKIVDIPYVVWKSEFVKPSQQVASIFEEVANALFLFHTTKGTVRGYIPNCERNIRVGKLTH